MVGGGGGIEGGGGADAGGAGYRTPASKSAFSTFDCFSPQKPPGLLGTRFPETRDGHLDFLTAPDLCSAPADSAPLHRSTLLTLPIYKYPGCPHLLLPPNCSHEEHSEARFKRAQ